MKFSADNDAPPTSAPSTSGCASSSSRDPSTTSSAGVVHSTGITRAVPSGELEKTLARLPARRLGQPDEVGAVYVFLASDRSRGTTGTFLHSDGGIGIKG